MSIAFWLSTPRWFEPEKVHDTPFGGAEISAINLAFALANELNQEILVFGNIEKAATVQSAYHGSKVTFYPYGKLKEKQVTDLICVRIDQRIVDPRNNPAFLPNPKPTITVWTGDEHTQPNNQALHDKWSLKEIRTICCKSNWQRENLLSHFPLLQGDKVDVIYNGVHLDRLPKPKKVTEPKFIYASTAYRGLHKFLKIWPMIRQNIPNATLDCYCKTTLYMPGNDRDRQFDELYKTLRTMPGVMIFDPLPQKDLLNIMPNYYAMLYPNHGFMESSCGVALEAMACGLPVITSAQAGLTETVNMGYGVLIHENPNTEEYDNTFTKQVVKLWTNRDNKLRLQKMASIREKYSWQMVARRWISKNPKFSSVYQPECSAILTLQ